MNELAKRFRGFLPIVVDIETGGFNSQTDAILEVAATEVSMNDQGFLSADQTHAYKVEPFEGANLESASLEFTGINPDDPTRQAIPEDTAFRELFKIIRQQVKANQCTRAILVGHNAHFDHSFIMAVTHRCQIKRNPFHSFSVFDTATLSGLAFGETVLVKACEAANIAFDRAAAHSAAYDAQKTAELFCYIVNHWKTLQP